MIEITFLNFSHPCNFLALFSCLFSVSFSGININFDCQATHFKKALLNFLKKKKKFYIIPTALGPINMRNLTSKGRTIPPRDSITVHRNGNRDNHLIIPGSFTGEKVFVTLVGINTGRI